MNIPSKICDCEGRGYTKGISKVELCADCYSEFWDYVQQKYKVEEFYDVHMEKRVEEFWEFINTHGRFPKKSVKMENSLYEWCQGVWRNVRGLADKYPNEVKVVMRPEENYGVLLIEVPKSWFKISPSRQRTLSEEEKTILSERLKNARQKRT